MRAVARVADVAEKTLYRIRDAKRNDDGEFDYSPSVAIAEKILVALDAIQPAETHTGEPQAPVTRGEACTAIEIEAAANPTACDDPQMMVEAACNLGGEGPRNEYERYIGHKHQRSDDKPSNPREGR